MSGPLPMVVSGFYMSSCPGQFALLAIQGNEGFLLCFMFLWPPFTFRFWGHLLDHQLDSFWSLTQALTLGVNQILTYEWPAILLLCLSLTWSFLKDLSANNFIKKLNQNLNQKLHNYHQKLHNSLCRPYVSQNANCWTWASKVDFFIFFGEF